jgi:predicted MFS family arabinose efflux permease
LAIVLTALAPAVSWLFVARALAGIGGAFIFGVCIAATSDLFGDFQRRNHALGVVGTAATLGALVGLPILTKLEETVGWRQAVAATAVLPIAILAGSSFLGGQAAPAPPALRPTWLGGYQRLLGDREAASLHVANIAISAVWFGFLIYLGAFAHNTLDYGADRLALLYVAGGVGEVAGNLGAPVLLRRLSARLTGLALAVLLTGLLFTLALVPMHGWEVFPIVTTVSLAAAGLFTVLNILVFEALPDARGGSGALLSVGFEVGGVVGVGLVALTAAGLIVVGRPRTATLAVP